jgi:hypothetical protein
MDIYKERTATEKGARKTQIFDAFQLIFPSSPERQAKPGSPSGLKGVHLVIPLSK